ncbi:uncharacterized protein LOC128555411 [Mercenaria mercenaria]|uniref:uncharacterized protein LOC128555411 n=1 Tax=Mercenaria mercenaria TaxID=6596 RepID=UPI00234F961C|nr:uncharacterized protein LOC128555411 [Mercenaria mercenaria]
MFSGTFDVHVCNLCPPHPSRSTRLLDHDHVGNLVESFQGNGCGQLVMMIGMVSPGTDLSRLREPGEAMIEVLGGNHTREALQALEKKGALDVEHVKVRLYRSLPQTSALALGFQHNYLLHEKKRAVTFLEKVKLMRDCRLDNKSETEWKDMLVIVFRLKDRRTLQQQMTHHLLMAKLPMKIWTMIMKFGDVPEKFYRNLMRLDDESLLETCLEVLLTEGPGKFRLKVKEYIDMGHTRSKRKTKKVSSSTPNTPALSDDNIVTEMEVDSNPTDMARPAK